MGQSPWSLEISQYWESRLGNCSPSCIGLVLSRVGGRARVSPGSLSLQLEVGLSTSVEGVCRILGEYSLGSWRPSGRQGTCGDLCGALEVGPGGHRGAPGRQELGHSWVKHTGLSPW